MTTRIGIIGGSGLYDLDGLTNVRDVALSTPFGEPSDPLRTGTWGDLDLVFVSRHGRGHRLMPSEIPYRANIFALKSLGVDTVISVSAVGSMREDLHPGDVVLPTQYVDRTRARPGTFFGDGLVAHISLADPVCPWLVETLAAATAACGLRRQVGGTYVCIEGPAFSTRAESNIFRSWGVDVIGMTALPEARLAREAELHYATLALVTDYDCWHATEEAVNVDNVVAVLKQNAANVQRILLRALPQLRALDAPKSCACPNALASAIITARDAIAEARREELAPIVGKYLA